MSHGLCACLLPLPVRPHSQAIPPAPNLWDLRPLTPPTALRRRDLGVLCGDSAGLPFSGEDSGGAGLLAARGAFLRGGGAWRGPAPARSLGARGSGGMHGGMRRRKRRVWNRRGEEEEAESGSGGGEGARDADELGGVYLRRGARGGKEGGVRETGSGGRERDRGAEGERAGVGDEGGGRDGKESEKERRDRKEEGTSKMRNGVVELRGAWNAKGERRNGMVGGGKQRERVGEKEEEGLRVGNGEERFARGVRGVRGVKRTSGTREEAEGVRGVAGRNVEGGAGEAVSAVAGTVVDAVRGVTGSVKDVTEKVKEVTDSVTESVRDTVSDTTETVKDVKSTVMDVMDSVEETIKGMVRDVKETVIETVEDTVKEVANRATKGKEEEGEVEEEEDMSPMRILLGASEERGRKAQSQLGIIQHRPSIVSLLYNLYSHMLKQPPLVFSLAVCSAPLILSLLFTLLYLPDLDGLVVEDTLLAYLQTSVAASAASALEDESFFAGPAMAMARGMGSAVESAGAAAAAAAEAGSSALTTLGAAAAEAAGSSGAAATAEGARAAGAAAGGGGGGGAVVTGLASTGAFRAPATAAAAAAAAKEAASGGLFNVVDGSQTLGDAVRALEQSNIFRLGPAGIISGGCAWGIFQVLMFSLSLSTGLEPALAPASPYALVVANVNALVAQLLFVFLSGAVFARLTQPVDPILCSKIACITPPLQQPQQGVNVLGGAAGGSGGSPPVRYPPAARSLSRSISSANFGGSAAFAASSSFPAAAGTAVAGGGGAEGGGFGTGGGGMEGGRGCERMLLVRYVLAGAQPCELVDVKVELTLKHNTLSCTGRFFRQVDHLKLVRSEDSYQRYGMTVRHLIDESSPLYGRSRDDLCLVNAQLSLAVIGMERASMQPVFHVEDYFVADEDVIWNADFEDMVYRDDKNRLLVDHRKISNWVGIEL
ncbi:unnamed protein product [Closterium sp. Naga37s-1]|nr:unnamed protein product [Closterium sp. Naga37s-1]